MNHDAILPAPFGALGVRVNGETLIGLEFLPPGTVSRAASIAAAVTVSPPSGCVTTTSAIPTNRARLGE